MDNSIGQNFIILETVKKYTASKCSKYNRILDFLLDLSLLWIMSYWLYTTRHDVYDEYNGYTGVALSDGLNITFSLISKDGSFVANVRF